MSKRKIFFVSFLILAAGLAAAAQRMVNFGGARGYLALPRGGGRHPAVIVIQEWWGLNGWIKQRADLLAAQGYVALAPDLYHGRLATTPRQAMALMRSFNVARGLRDLQSAYLYLRHLSAVRPHHIGALGWCFGGGMAMRFARRQPGLRALAVYYGELPPPGQLGPFAAKIRAPMLGNFGGADRSIPPAEVRQLAADLRVAGRHPEIKIYPGMPHAFAHLTTPAGRAAARDAWRRTLRFLRRHLQS